MTATPDRLNLPARRRRHARLIAALTELTGACAEAAAAVYWPIATAPPDQEAVTVDLMPLRKVALSAAIALDHAPAGGSATEAIEGSQHENHPCPTRAVPESRTRGTHSRR